MSKILIVEDDITIIRTLEAYLLSEGFETVSVSGQRQALSALEKEIVDLLILDISLAEGNGFAVCEAAKGHGLPVIFLTASGDENSVVRGLDMGADDYIAKPFRPRELVSRIRSVLRRSGKTKRVVMLGSVSVDAEKGIVSKSGTEINLSALEFRLLMAFVNHRGKLLTRNALLEEIWDAGGDFVNDNTLTVYIKRLREKIEDDPQKPEIIKTVRGLGYRVD
jgi:DNA-binding response OmpR family regulator